MKKRGATLLELMISLTLLSLLLTTFLFWTTRYFSSQKKLNLQKRESVELRCLDQRLQNLFGQSKNTQSREGGFSCFDADEKSVLFTFDRGAFHLAQYSHKVVGRLWHDLASQTLYLSIQPLPKWENSEWLHYPLLDRVVEVQFSYYHPPDLLKLAVNPDHVGRKKPKEGWQKNWESQYPSLPALIEMTLCREEKTKEKMQHTFYFDLGQTIYYPVDLEEPKPCTPS